MSLLVASAPQRRAPRDPGMGVLGSRRPRPGDLSSGATSNQIRPEAAKAMRSDSVSPTSDSESQSTRALMKTLKFVSSVAASLFTLNVQASISAEPAFERPQVALAADTPILFGRVEHALLQYAKACETDDHAAISQTLTDTAIL
jgi:hypothetical protein